VKVRLTQKQSSSIRNVPVVFMEDEEFAEWYTNKMLETGYRFGDQMSN